MERRIFTIIIFFSLVLLIFFLLFLKNHFEEKKDRVCFKNHCFEVELAATSEERKIGLMNRKNLDPHKGMLFVFDEERKHSFWMKNTLIFLDIIWINADKEVVYISENTQPCKEPPCPLIQPTEKAKYVLEINGGVAKKIGLTVGDKIRIESSKL